MDRCFGERGGTDPLAIRRLLVVEEDDVVGSRHDFYVAMQMGKGISKEFKDRTNELQGD